MCHPCTCSLQEFQSISNISPGFLWRLQFGEETFNQKNIWFVFSQPVTFWFFCSALLFCNVGIVTFCRHIERQPACTAASKHLYFSLPCATSDALHSQSARKELSWECTFQKCDVALKKCKWGGRGSMSGGSRDDLAARGFAWDSTKPPLFSLKYAKCFRTKWGKEAYSDLSVWWQKKWAMSMLLPMLVVNVNPVKVN